jgi:tetratricopeptide (TPR) repeat protein
MDSDVADLPLSHKIWAWLETNRKQALWGASLLVVFGLVAAFFFWQQGEKEITAGEELSNAALPALTAPGPRQGLSGAYLKVAATYPKSSAGARALLLAAGNLFTEGKYDQAKAEFEKFTREHRDSPFLADGLLGIAACLDAQGKTNEAITAYKELIDRHSTAIVLPQAKFALANLYEAQGKVEQARTLFEDVVTKAGPYGSLGSEAGMRLEELQIKYPKATTTSSAPLTTTPAPLTLTPTPAPVLPTQTPGTPTRAPAPSNSVPLKLQKP